MEIIARYKKIILAVAIVLVISELVWAYFTLKAPIPKSQSQAVQDLGPKASIALQGPTQVSSGETFKVDVNISTAATVDGTDLIIKYDPNSLDLIPPTGNTAATAGKTFQVYPVNTFDSKTGTISLSAVVTNQGFTGQGLVGSINFKAKKSGQTKISIDYTPNNSSSSVVAESNTAHDILKSVTNLDVNIK